MTLFVSQKVATFLLVLLVRVPSACGEALFNGFTVDSSNSKGLGLPALSNDLVKQMAQNFKPSNFGTTSTTPGLTFFDVEKFENTTVLRKPFVHFVVEQFVPPGPLALINRDFPPLLTKNKHVEESELWERKEIFGNFKDLLDHMRGAAFRSLIEKKFRVNLKKTEPRITLRGFCDPCEGKIHVDSVCKTVTILLYLNEHAWEGDGGNLKLLTGPRIKDAVSQVPSYEGNLLVFKNAKHAWHGFTHYQGPRRAIQLNYEIPELRSKTRTKKVLKVKN